MLNRVLRRAAWMCGSLALGALVLMPDRPRVALGVLGGGVLIGLAYWGLSGLVAAVAVFDETGRIRPVSRAFPLVKFFTRHVILAVAGYLMVVRLHLDPVGMLIGVTSIVAAAAVEAVRRPKSEEPQ